MDWTFSPGQRKSISLPTADKSIGRPYPVLAPTHITLSCFPGHWMVFAALAPSLPDQSYHEARFYEKYMTDVKTYFISNIQNLNSNEKDPTTRF